MSDCLPSSNLAAIETVTCHAGGQFKLFFCTSFDLFSLSNLMSIQRQKVNLPFDLHFFHPGNIY